MTHAQLSKDELAAMARAVGLELSDERLERLLPEVESLSAAFERLARLDLKRHEPSVVFRPGRN